MITNHSPLHCRGLFKNNVLRTLHVSITMPARNEEQMIERSLAALYYQRNTDGSPMDKSIYEVLVLANNCTDSTYEIVQAFSKAYPDFNLHVEQVDLLKDEAHVGICRRILMDSACTRLEQTGRGHDGIIITTDADTTVDPLWLHHTLQEFRNGCEVLGGRIMITSDDAIAQHAHENDEKYRFLCTRLEAYMDPLDHDPWPRHFQCFGPSTAVRCDLYRKVGGIPLLPHLEDAQFARDLFMVDAKIRHSLNVKVYSSGRLQGRVSFGFSKQLQLWKEMQQRREEILVEGIDALKKKLQVRRKMRDLFFNKESSISAKQMGRLSRHIAVSSGVTAKILESSKYFGEFWEHLSENMDVSSWQATYPLVPIEEAIKDLEKQFNTDTAA